MPASIEADVELVDLGAEDAAQAFLLREVDAAVTYEPFLSAGACRPGTATF